MKRKVLSVLLTVAICTVMTGCGSEPSAATAETAPAVADDIAAEEPATSEYMDDASMADSYTEQQDESATEAAEDDFGRPPEEDIVAWNEEFVSEAEKIEGIVVLVADWEKSVYCLDYTIISINPDTGAQHNITSFQFTEVFPDNNRDYTITPGTQYSRYGNYYDQFSEDYSKAAASKTFSGNGEVHAGWIDSNGVFFDITEALNEQSQSDFGDPVSYYAVGFQNGIFIYVHPIGYMQNEYYGVSIDDICPGASWPISSADMMICEEYATWGWANGGKPTAWIDGQRFICDGVDSQSRIMDMETKSVTEYIPGTSRDNWNGVINQNGEMIAFLSSPKTGTGDVGIYLVPFNGGDPISLSTDFVPPSTRRGSAGSVNIGISAGNLGCSLLEWR